MDGLGVILLQIGMGEKTDAVQVLQVGFPYIGPRGAYVKPILSSEGEKGQFPIWPQSLVTKAQRSRVGWEQNQSQYVAMTYRLTFTALTYTIHMWYTYPNPPTHPRTPPTHTMISNNDTENDDNQNILLSISTTVTLYINGSHNSYDNTDWRMFASKATDW